MLISIDQNINFHYFPSNYAFDSGELEKNTVVAKNATSAVDDKNIVNIMNLILKRIANFSYWKTISVFVVVSFLLSILLFFINTKNVGNITSGLFFVLFLVYSLLFVPSLIIHLKKLNKTFFEKVIFFFYVSVAFIILDFALIFPLGLFQTIVSGQVSYNLFTLSPLVSIFLIIFCLTYKQSEKSEGIK